MKLLTLADGYGDSVAVPTWYPGFLKWPEIIKFITKGVELDNLSRYGAGNEYISQCFRQHLNHDVVLIQWAVPERLDLVLDHQSTFWTEQISSDKVYNNNIVNLGQDRFWLSSSSMLDPVQEYHKKFISARQHRLRSQLLIEHATLLMLYRNIKHKFLLTCDSEYLQSSITDQSNWCWHEQFKGMDSFRTKSKFAELDLGLTQPVSLIQFDFVKQFIMPQLDLPWRSNREIDAVENMLHRKYKEAVALKPNDQI